MTQKPIFKIVEDDEWREARASGIYTGAAVDRADGFIHFSTAGQVEETAARHFGGKDNLLLVAVDPASLGDRLKYEPSRGGALFPHLYGDLALTTVIGEWPLPLDGNGRHDFTGLL